MRIETIARSMVFFNKLLGNAAIFCPSFRRLLFLSQFLHLEKQFKGSVLGTLYHLPLT